MEKQVMRPLLRACAGVLLACLMPSWAAASIDANLKYGDRGAQVQELQGFLMSGGFLQGSATGNFYALTQKAVRAFQGSAGLPQTGYVGPLTRTAIASNANAATSTASDATISSSSIDRLSAQTQDLLRQISALESNGAVASSALEQTYATSTASFSYDPKWQVSIVNLFCQGRFAGDLSSGTGIVIDPRGVILTNAHVAYDFLFSEWPNPSLEDCSVRVGSPASPLYRAKLLYLPDGWATATIANAFSPNATTTYGAKDYALLVIASTTDPSATLPASFPYLPIRQGDALPVNSPAYLSGYAAENLGVVALLRGLYLLSTPATVDAQRGIGTSTQKDVIAFSGPIVSQHGASGGAVIDGDGEVAGILTFLDAGYGQTTDQRVLNAITTGYVLRDFAEDSGMSLQAFLSTPDLLGAAKKFNDEKASIYQAAYAKQLKDHGFSVPGAY